MTNDQLEIDGYCPICESAAKFIANGKWYRGTLKCQSCEGGSIPRDRAMAYILNRELPDWRNKAIHECSPMESGISNKIRKECKDYIGSHYYPDQPLGNIVGQWRNENIEATTFPDNVFDLVVTMDVTEHVYNPGAMFRDIWRTLKPRGVYLSTFPIRKYQVEAAKPRAIKAKDGTIKFLVEPPEYHGNPIDNAGALVTWDFGYEIHQLIKYWTPFIVEVVRFSDQHQGILGEYTEVVICRKQP